VWSRDPYSTRCSRVLYGSRDHSPSSHKSRIDLQTHIMCFTLTFPRLASITGCASARWRHCSIILLLNIRYWPYHTLRTIKEVKVWAVPLIYPCTINGQCCVSKNRTCPYPRLLKYEKEASGQKHSLIRCKGVSWNHKEATLGDPSYLMENIARWSECTSQVIVSAHQNTVWVW